ncbi:hypothetical protein DSM03_11359 [Leeuwenhoekiella aestuarii]|uniref:Uncharacterized protein n=1 Tax=Leeuwenhoekiella aestuarii TaxID=2249426 RepID=A0A4Q0NN66_9FLAO|nr:hypothetical protein DSM04_11259 [Leeuwenhoekiella aestuarii]RXG11866.1 hypothetical protein DSM03_11359 [Leeuwenhoekiella aestuarii]
MTKRLENVVVIEFSAFIIIILEVYVNKKNRTQAV